MEDLLNRNQKGGLYSVASEEAWEGFKQESKDPVCVSEKALWQGHGEQVAEGGDKEGKEEPCTLEMMQSWTSMVVVGTVGAETHWG